MPPAADVRRPLAAARLALLLALGAAAVAIGQAPPDSPLVLSIVGTNDLHGAILPREGRGGLALFGGYVGNLRDARGRDGGAVVLVDAGDMFQGTLESNLNEGAVVVAAYNALGYAAAAIGNHEFDFGPSGPAPTARPGEDPRGALKARAAEARFPFLAANLIDEATGGPVEWPNVRPSALIEAAGVRVGLTGVMTSEALRATIPTNVGGLRLLPLAAAIAREGRRLRDAGAAVVIVAAHAGGRCADVTPPADLSSCDPASEIIPVARALPPGLVDVIVAGHSHAGMAHMVESTAIIESFQGGRAFGRVDVVLDRATHKVLDKRIHPPREVCARVLPGGAGCDTGPRPAPGAQPAHYEGAPVAPDAAVAAVLEPALAAVRELKAQPIGVYLETPIRRILPPDAPLGNLFTDALLASVPGADAALHNTTGGLRADWPAGPLTYGSVYEVMPFDNRVVVLTLTGAELRRVFAEHLQRTRRVLGVSGLTVRAHCAGGILHVAMHRPSGDPVRDAERLQVAVNDFLAAGGDGILKPIIPPEGFAVPEDAPLARDLFAEYLRKRGGSLREAALVDEKRPRISFAGTLPAVCASQRRAPGP